MEPWDRKWTQDRRRFYDLLKKRPELRSKFDAQAAIYVYGLTKAESEDDLKRKIKWLCLLAETFDYQVVMLANILLTVYCQNNLTSQLSELIRLLEDLTHEWPPLAGLDLDKVIEFALMRDCQAKEIISQRANFHFLYAVVKSKSLRFRLRSMSQLRMPWEIYTYYALNKLDSRLELVPTPLYVKKEVKFTTKIFKGRLKREDTVNTRDIVLKLMSSPTKGHVEQRNEDESTVYSRLEQLWNHKSQVYDKEDLSHEHTAKTGKLFRRPLERRVFSKFKSKMNCEVWSIGQVFPWLPFTLADVLGGSLELRQVYKIMQRLKEAFKTLQDWRIVHRDIKPSNIYLTDEYIPVVCDFGVAFCTDQPDTNPNLVGTLDYMAPELRTVYQCEAPVECTLDYVKCDAFSLGLVFFQLLTGDSVSGLNTNESYLQTSLQKLPEGQYGDVTKRLLSFRVEDRPYFNEISFQNSHEIRLPP